MFCRKKKEEHLYCEFEEKERFYAEPSKIIVTKSQWHSGPLVINENVSLGVTTIINECRVCHLTRQILILGKSLTKK